MNAPERADLKLALDFLREWREDDKDWKAATDVRLTRLESRNIAADAVSADRARTSRRAIDDWRWRVGIISGIAGAVVLGVLNLVTNVLAIHH